MPCFDPIFLEPPKHVLIHQFIPQTPTLSTLPWPNKQPEIPIEKTPETSNKNGEDETEKVYVHPLIKNSSSSYSSSSSSLSLKSLEMCTESLGSETGSGIDLNIDELSYHNPTVMAKQRCGGAIEKAKTQKFADKVKKGGTSFPPPLSSIAGSDGVQVKTHREGGRLVIKAFSLSSTGNYFRAERENGRLRLSLLKDSSFGDENELSENQEEEEEAEEKVSGDEQEIYCEESDDDDEEGDSNGGFWKVGGGIGGGDQWSVGSRWCNGGGSSRKRLPTLPFCVAIS